MSKAAGIVAEHRCKFWLGRQRATRTKALQANRVQDHVNAVRGNLWVAVKPRAAAVVYSNVAHDPGKEEGRFIESFGGMANQQRRGPGNMRQRSQPQTSVR